MLKIKKIHPMFTGVLTTSTRYKGEQFMEKNGLILDTRKLDGMANPMQRVVAVGDSVRELKEGDIVCINFSRYVVPDHRPGKIENNIEHDNLGYKYVMPVVEMGGQEYYLLQANDISYYMRPSEGDCEIDGGGLLQ